MGKIVAVHSYKGGTGKTLISLNLAVTLAKMGKKVCLMDLDFRAPSLSILLKIEKAQYWLNDYLNGSCEIDKVMIDLSLRIAEKDRFYVCPANPSIEAIRDITARDRKWEMRALGRLLFLRNALLKDRAFDYVVFDTSPGLQYSAINAIVAADIVLVATTLDSSDVEGTRMILHGLYDLFEKKAEIVLNKVTFLDSVRVGREKLQKMVKDVYSAPLLEAIPCFCEISKAEGKNIFVHEKPDHPFTKIMYEMATKIEKL
ncbi:MAG: MinD/ParA family protein [Candidatus Bathyarchaeota archaeon]|nr:MinD/ParA family protein [Candidatus Bathyarchaeota archaeon]MCX8177822.1 MinD/ParA family protein [Candidatus Bathyarchaeota archaeon]MDW8194422.1 MinD/ParA family protein [Nitrososphaerota archaeon]